MADCSLPEKVICPSNLSTYCSLFVKHWHFK